jgi:serine/threonine protein kinase
VPTAAALFDLIKRSNLLSPEQLERAYAMGDLLRKASQNPRGAGAVVANDPRLLATQLARQGLLTVWQARQLLAGRHTFFLGKYKLLDQLASGRRGKLYKAEHVAMRRVVALKVMAKEYLEQPGVLERFQEEVRATALVSHPNIVATYDGDCIDDVHFLVMEFVDGRHLREWLKEYGRMPVDWACEVARQCSLGLGHAFEHGVVIRDIRPSGLLVIDEQIGGPPVVKILDLGLMRLTDPAAALPGGAGTVLASPDYLAPEQARQPRCCDLRSDIFGLGCILFELLAGSPPFSGATPQQKLQARLHQDAPRLLSMRPDAPPALDGVVSRMLVRDPGGRFQNFAEVAEALLPFAFRKHGHWDEASSMAFPVRGAQLGRIEAAAEEGLDQFLNHLSSKADENPISQRTTRRR